MLQQKRFVTAFAGEESPVKLSALQQAALAYFLDACAYSAAYSSLASGWPSDETVQQARAVFQKHAGMWPQFGVAADAHEIIQRQLPLVGHCRAAHRAWKDMMLSIPSRWRRPVRSHLLA